MSYALFEIGSSIFSRGNSEDLSKAIPLIDAIHEHGLAVRAELSGDFTITSTETAVNVLGGGETENNLRLLTSYFSQLRNLSIILTRTAFRQNVRAYVQDGNRSVDSALRNLNNGLVNMLEFMKNFVGKDIKLPVKYLWLKAERTNYGFIPDLLYTEEQTGTYHTIQQAGAQSCSTWSTYLEDSPSVRRYLRYVDSIARRSGIRLVYCPKTLQSLDELTEHPSPPAWIREGDQMVRTVRTGRFNILYVSLAFHYETFRDLTIIETEVQPGQRPRQAEQMDYTPIFVDNLAGIVKVLTTIGGFAACKIYYKDYRNSARSLQAARSS